MTQITCNIINHMAADDGRKTADHQSEPVNKLLLQIADQNVGLLKKYPTCTRSLIWTYRHALFSDMGSTL